MTAEDPTAGRGVADEELLRELYAEILNVASVGYDDSFFAHHGDSIAVLRLVGRAREAGLEIGIQDVFEAKTVRGLAAVASAARGRTQIAAERPTDESCGMEPLSQEELDEIAAEMKR